MARSAARCLFRHRRRSSMTLHSRTCPRRSPSRPHQCLGAEVCHDRRRRGRPGSWASASAWASAWARVRHGVSARAWRGCRTGSAGASGRGWAGASGQASTTGTGARAIGRRGAWAGRWRRRRARARTGAGGGQWDERDVTDRGRSGSRGRDAPRDDRDLRVEDGHGYDDDPTGDQQGAQAVPAEAWPLVAARSAPPTARCSRLDWCAGPGKRAGGQGQAGAAADRA